MNGAINLVSFRSYLSLKPYEKKKNNRTKQKNIHECKCGIVRYHRSFCLDLTFIRQSFNRINYELFFLQFVSICAVDFFVLSQFKCNKVENLKRCDRCSVSIELRYYVIMYATHRKCNEVFFCLFCRREMKTLNNFIVNRKKLIFTSHTNHRIEDFERKVI